MSKVDDVFDFADELIDEWGHFVTFVRKENSIYDPETGATTETETRSQVKVVISKLDISEYGGLYQANDVKIILDPKSFPGFGGAAGDAAPTGTYIKRQKIDVLEIEYDQFNENQYNDDCSDCSLPAILQEFPWLKDLLGCWLGNVSTTGNRLIRLFRN